MAREQEAPSTGRRRIAEWVVVGTIAVVAIWALRRRVEYLHMADLLRDDPGAIMARAWFTAGLALAGVAALHRHIGWPVLWAGTVALMSAQLVSAVDSGGSMLAWVAIAVPFAVVGLRDYHE